MDNTAKDRMRRMRERNKQRNSVTDNVTPVTPSITPDVTGVETFIKHQPTPAEMTRCRGAYDPITDTFEHPPVKYPGVTYHPDRDQYTLDPGCMYDKRYGGTV